MTALVRSTLVVAAVAGLLAAAGQPTAAQKKEAKAGKPGTVEVKQGKDDKYRFTVRDADGKFLAMSGPTGFATKAEAVKALDALKAALDGAKVVDKGAGKDDDEDMKDEKKKDTKKKDKGGS
ncbi:MAG: hypothetical protein K2X87_15485 [Gemmataceae bacterium]|nr:hypothetical protein [Gemmataceae bacterium]